MDNLLPLASLTSVLSDLLTNHGVLAVFAVMAVDALLPVGGELVMLLAGALAAGAIGGGATFFGADLGTGAGAYIVLSLAGTVGYLVGAIAGWAIGRRGGLPLVERHGRWLHLGPDRMQAARQWFDRHGSRAVLLGRLTPLVRSFISIPAGIFGSPFSPYVVLTAVGSAIWCFSFAAAGWALGNNFDVVHHAFRYLDIAVVVLAVGIAAVILRGRRRGQDRPPSARTR